MLIAICGNLGWGKTLTLTAIGKIAQLGGYRIFSNYPVKYPFTFIKNPEAIEKVKEGIFLGDELWLWLDSRTSPSKRNMFISKILLKSRKRKFHVLYTTQSLMQIDIRIRRITDVFLLPKFIPPHWCKISFYGQEGKRYRSPLTFDARPIYPMYDTSYEILDEA